MRTLRFALLTAVLLAAAGCGSSPDGPSVGPVPPPPAGTDYYVALLGSDTTGDGSQGNPWRTLQHAAATVPAAGGFTIFLGDGIYDGATAITRGFDAGVTIRSQQPYGATLTNIAGNETVLFVAHQGPTRLTFQELVISNEGSTGNPCASAAGHLIHLSNVSDVTFLNNVIYGNDRMPRCNDAIKINLDNATTFPTGIRFLGNYLANPPAVDGREMIDVFEPGELDFADNIFASARGRTGGEAFVKLWGEWGSTTARSPRYRIQRNIFVGYEGGAAKGFVELGGEGASIFEISDALIENNLFIGSSTSPMLAPLVLRGVQDVTVRANTFVGDLPATAFAVALGSDGSNPASREVLLGNNIWCDPSGTMGSTLAHLFGAVDLPTVTMQANLLWNAANPLPSSGELTPDDDPQKVVADPALPGDPTGVAAPSWVAAQRRFASGATTVREEFARLVAEYAAIGAASPARGGAAGGMPADDILGNARDGSPDIGAFER